MSAIKRALEDIEELADDAICRGANNVNDVIVYVNAYSTFKPDDEVIEKIWEKYFSWYDEELEYQLETNNA